MFEKKLKSKGRVWLIPIDQISPSPYQPRKDFDRRQLEGLARSIAYNGLLVPISVRERDGGGYWLIAGERRLEACKSLGFHEIAAIVEDVGAEESAVLTLIENIHRRSLNCFEEAEGIRTLLTGTGYSQITVCGMLDMPQSTVANKLRLLKLPDSVRSELLQNGLGERIARSLLRLPDEQMQLDACKRIAHDKMGAAAADEYIDRLLCQSGKEVRRTRAIFRDIRFLFSPVDKAVEEIRRAGVEVTAKRSEEDKYICYTIRVPKAQACAAREQKQLLKA